MRVVVNKFITQVEDRVNQVTKKIDKDTVKKGIAVGKQVVEKVPKKDQLIKRFTSPVCTLKIQNNTELAYTKIKRTLDIVGRAVEGIKKNVIAVDRQVNNIIGFIDKVRKILDKVENIVNILQKVVDTLQVAVMSIPAQFVTAGLIIKLGDIVKVSEGMIKVFKALIVHVPKTLDFFDVRIKRIHSKIDPIRKEVLAADNYIKYHRQVLESVYLKYLKVCNVTDQEPTDPQGNVNEENIGGTGANSGTDQQDAVDDFLSNDPTPENTLNAQDPLADMYTDTIQSLQAQGDEVAVERLYRADFSQIPMDRKKAYEKIDI